MFVKSALTALLASAALAAPASANVQVGSSGWVWGNPLPQGNTLRAMSFAGSTGYAAGDTGTLLKTTDGGSTWTGLQVGTFTGLDIVQALDATTVFAGGGCVARRSTDGGKTFTRIAFTPVEANCRAGLEDMSFVSATNGFLLLGNSSVFTTSDGGTEFAQRTAIPSPASGGHATAIAFTSATTGFAATSNGTLYATTDGAVSWKLVSSGTPAINRIAFVDASHGFAVGNGGTLLRTNDGGQTWKLEHVGGGQDLTAIHCATPQLCMLSTDKGAALVRTTDGGATAGSVVTPSTDPIYAAAFASPTRVAAVGAGGATVTSDDGGVTFAPVGGQLHGSYVTIRAGAARGSAYAIGDDGALAVSTDAGHTWKGGNVPTSNDLLDVSFPTTASGYALDDDGGLFATTNGGQTWKTLGTGSTARGQAVYAPSTKAVLVVGPHGVRRSKNGGGSFAAVRGPIAHAVIFEVSAVRGAIFVWGNSSLLRSTNGGASWKALGKPGASKRAQRRLAIDQIAFSSRNVGLLLDSIGNLWRTTSAGRHWSRVDGVGTIEIRGIAAGSDRSAYAFLEHSADLGPGTVLRTTDAGATWQPESVLDATIDGIATSGSGSDYLLADNTSLLATTTGGLAGRRSALTLGTAHRRLRKPGRITVSGRLKPAHGNEQVVVSMRTGSSTWRHDTVTVASNGTFVSSWRVPRGTSTFVAQWTGDVASAGTGSRAMTVLVKR